MNMLRQIVLWETRILMTFPDQGTSHLAICSGDQFNVHLLATIFWGVRYAASRQGLRVCLSGEICVNPTKAGDFKAES